MRRLNSIMTGLIAALLIVLALPRLVGALVQVPHEPLIAPVAALGTQTDRARRADNIDLEIAGRLQALEWIDDGRVWRALGAAQLKKASSGLPGKARRAALASARASLTESLKRAPANPFAWSRLIGTIPITNEAERLRVERMKQMTPAKIAPVIVALSSDAAQHVTGQIFAVRGSEVMLMGQSRPLRSMARPDGWTPETVLEHVFPAMQSAFYDLDRSGDIFTWDPV